MATTATARRSAQISFGTKTDLRPIRVSYTGKLTREDIGRVEKALIDDVIPGLTGCSCLSGIIDVIWEKRFEKVIDVKL